MANEKKTCPECNGEKVVPCYCAANVNTSVPAISVCKGCNGTQQLPCRECDGEGEVPE